MKLFDPCLILLDFIFLFFIFFIFARIVGETECIKFFVISYEFIIK